MSITGTLKIFFGVIFILINLTLWGFFFLKKHKFRVFFFFLNWIKYTTEFYKICRIITFLIKHIESISHLNLMLWWLWLKRDDVWQSMLPGYKFGPDQTSWFSRERVSGVPDNVIYTCTSLTICLGCTMRCMWNQCVPTMGAKQRGRILETEHGDKLLKPQSLFYINYMSLNKHGCTFGRQAITRQ